MSQNPGGPPPPYSYGYPHHPHHPPPAPGAYAYVPAPVMMPMPVYQPPPPQPEPAQPTYVTNYIYQQPAQPEPVHVVDRPSGASAGLLAGLNLVENLATTCKQLFNNAPPPSVYDMIDWVPSTGSTAASLTHRAVVAGKEGWDSSPLWVIRAYHSGECVPGKLAIKHRQGYIPYAGKEIPVHNFEVLCAPAHTIRWLPASNGQVPVGAIPAGNTHSGEALYIGRAKYMRSLTPGKVHPSHGCLYMSFGGNEVPHKQYEVLCKIVG